MQIKPVIEGDTFGLVSGPTVSWGSVCFLPQSGSTNNTEGRLRVTLQLVTIHLTIQKAGSDMSNLNSQFLRRSAVLLAALLLGSVIGASLFPVTTFNLLRHEAAYAYLAAGWGALAFAALALVAVERARSRRQRQDRNLLESFLEHIPANVFFKDLDSRFIRISNAMANYCGLVNPAEAVHKTDAEIFSAEHADQALTDEQEIIRTGLPMVDKEEKETWPDGRETWTLTTKVPLRNQSGKTIGTMGIAHNITDRKQAELRIRHMALHDLLTGLPNRILLEDRLAGAIASAKRNRHGVAVLMLDLDRFRTVNDSFGHYIGDRLLESVAARLKGCLRESDTIARLGGDEFVVALPGVADSNDIASVAQKLQAGLAAPFQVDGRQVQLTASIGISNFPEHGEKPELLLQCSEAAMYEAKKKGRGQYGIFSTALTGATRRQQQLESDLMHACERDQFVLHYQPIVDSTSGSITGVEALLRWMHPAHGLIAPNQFIPQLEDLGQMAKVGHWVLEKACGQAMEWQRQGFSPIRMSVNVSSQQFYQGKIVETVESVLQETKLDPTMLELELTESRLLDDSEATISIMRRLKQIGISLALDDFGTGWSSLSYLRRFPFDRLKIDRSFVRDLASQATAEAMVKCILGMGQNLSLACIAEGVETSRQRDFLQAHNCPEMQGFLFSRPLPACGITEILHSAKRASTRTRDNRRARAYAPILSSAQTPTLTPAVVAQGKWGQ